MAGVVGIGDVVGADAAAAVRGGTNEESHRARDPDGADEIGTLFLLVIESLFLGQALLAIPFFHSRGPGLAFGFQPGRILSVPKDLEAALNGL